MSQTATTSTPPPTVLVVDEDPDWRALAELQIRIAPGLRFIGSAATLPAAMDHVLLTAPSVVVVGLGRARPTETDDLTLLRMLAPTTPLVIASIHGPDDARRRSEGLTAWHVDKIELVELLAAIADAVGTHAGSDRDQSDGRGASEGHGAASSSS